jgi:AcrR family transcriptional regulator
MSSPPTTETTKGERTYQAILDSAYLLFLQNGYSATSMRQIALAAGLTPGGIYNHFPGKDEIFQALVIAKHPYLTIFPVLQEAPGDTAEAFIANVTNLLEATLGNDPDFIKLMFIEIVEFRGRHFPKLVETIYPMMYPLIARFDNPESDLRPEIALPTLVRVFIGNIFAYYLTEILLHDSGIPSEIRTVRLEDFMQVFLHGVLR